MKRYISIIILIFVIANAFVGCVPDGSQENKNDIGINDGENTNGNGEDVENGANNSNEGGENAENGGDSSTEGGESAENDSSISTDGSENNDSGGENEEDTPTYVVGSEVGNLFASVALERLDGGTVSPDDYRGKIVIVNIWATWCPPCKAELPDFNNIASEYADDVVIIAAHDYAGRANAPDYVAENFPETKIVFAYDSYNGDAYIVAGGDGYIPFTAILDRNGVIVYSDSGMLSYDQLVGIIEQIKSQK